jgi:hypothetical protein
MCSLSEVVAHVIRSIVLLLVLDVCIRDISDSLGN